MSDNTTTRPSVSLPDDQWATLIDNINLAQKMVFGRDRREADRYDFDFPTTLYAEFNHDQDTGWQRFLVRTRNISSTGLGFIHHVEVPAGQRVVFTCFDKTGSPFTMIGTSARVDLIEDGVWDIGIKFSQPIDPAQLIDLDGIPLAMAS